MKLKIFSIMLFGTLSFSALSQGNVKQAEKIEWNPKEKIEQKVERFSASTEISEEQSSALTEVLQSHHEKRKNMRSEVRELSREERMSKMKEVREEKDEAVKLALGDDTLFEAWKAFELDERKQKRMRHSEKKQYDNQPQRQELKKEVK